MDPEFYCKDCNTSYVRQYILSQHLKSRKHITRIKNSSSLYSCECGKSYTHENSLKYHKKTCDFKPNQTPLRVKTTCIETIQRRFAIIEKEHHEMKAQLVIIGQLNQEMKDKLAIHTERERERERPPHSDIALPPPQLKLQQNIKSRDKRKKINKGE